MAMRVLIISNLFPPFSLGGAEMAASSLAARLAGGGHEVCVLTSAPRPAQEESSRRADGVRIERRFFPNSYSVFEARARPVLHKAAWHFRDHFNRHSESICRAVVEAFRPDIVNTHDLQGIGYNIVREIGRRGLPCVQTLHDLGFLCINMNMFRDGEACRRRHAPCAVSSLLKGAYLSTIKTLAFWSPSQALLERYRPHLPRHVEAVSIPLPLRFSPPPEGIEARSAAPVRLLYAGQFTEPKGVGFLLETLEPLAEGNRFELALAGGGPLLERLKEKYAGKTWVSFAGRLPPEEVAGFMARGDLLMIPSLWFENSPVVAYQAGQLGLPILASNVGGLPELVRDGVNGLLLPAGDAERWRACVRDLLARPEKLDRLREGAKANAKNFDPDLLGGAVVRLFERTLRAASAPARAVYTEADA